MFLPKKNYEFKKGARWKFRFDQDSEREIFGIYLKSIGNVNNGDKQSIEMEKNHSNSFFRPTFKIVRI